MQRDKIQACLVQVDWLRKCLSKASTLKEKNRDIDQAYAEVIDYLNEIGPISLFFSFNVLALLKHFLNQSTCTSAACILSLCIIYLLR